MPKCRNVESLVFYILVFRHFRHFAVFDILAGDRGAAASCRDDCTRVMTAFVRGVGPELRHSASIPAVASYRGAAWREAINDACLSAVFHDKRRALEQARVVRRVECAVEISTGTQPKGVGRTRVEFPPNLVAGGAEARLRRERARPARAEEEGQRVLRRDVDAMPTCCGDPSRSAITVIVPV